MSGGPGDLAPATVVLCFLTAHGLVRLAKWLHKAGSRWVASRGNGTCSGGHRGCNHGITRCRLYMVISHTNLLVELSVTMSNHHLLTFWKALAERIPPNPRVECLRPTHGGTRYNAIFVEISLASLRSCPCHQVPSLEPLTGLIERIYSDFSDFYQGCSSTSSTIPRNHPCFF